MSPAIDPILPAIDPALLQETPHQPLPAPVPSISEHLDNVVDVTPRGSCLDRSLSANGLGSDKESASGLVRTQKRGRTQASTTGIKQSTYSKLSVATLKDHCRKRSLKVGGTKPVLIARLEASDAASSRIIPASMNSNDLEVESEPAALRVNPELAEKNARELQESYETALRGECEEEDGPGNGGVEEEEEFVVNDDDDGDSAGLETGDLMDVDSPVSSAKAWIDDYILQARRKSGRQTEKSVLSLWKRWVPGAIAAGIIRDVIVDADHTMEYLKYAATRRLLTSVGREQNGNDRLSPASLKKVMTMLGRVRRRQADDDPTLGGRRPASSTRGSDFCKALMVEAQRLRLETEDFDICENTILDSQLFPEHFEQVTTSIFSNLDQLPSIIKAHFSWTWQCTKLNRGDELVNLLLSCIQPYQLCVPEHMPINGRRPGLGRYLFGVLSLYHETKVPKPGKPEPDYNFVLPHRNPLRCSIGALALLLHFVFDQEDLCGKSSGWDWSCPSSWRQVKLMFGKMVGKPCSPDTLRKMYTTFLESTTIKSKKKLHLARRTMPAVMEDMGVTMDEIDAIGHWAGNTRREVYAAKIPKSAVVALAGFYVGEAYNVPWAGIPVPDDLQMKIFPFVELALVNLKSSSKLNQGVVNFLELLQQLRPFFWRVSAAIYERFPDCAIFRRMKAFSCPTAQTFFAAWPGLCENANRELEVEMEIASTFSELPTQTAFMSLTARQKEFEAALRVQTAHLKILTRRTEPLSPTCARSIADTSAAVLEYQTPDEGSCPPTPSVPCICGRSSRLTPPQAASGPQIRVNGPSLSPTMPTSPPTPSLTTHLPASSTELLCHPHIDSTNSESASAPSNNLCIVAVSIKNICFNVLRLSPGSTAPATPFDIILPPAAAFYKAGDSVGARYPSFTSATCGWHAIFECIVQPSLLWDCWGPGSLGEYADILTLWKSWNEGTFIAGVGQKPPLRLVDAQWGCHKDQRSNKGHLPAWRPRRDDNARRKWSQYQFFTKRIDDSMANGMTALQAIHELDILRGSRTLPQLHRELQPKGRKKKKSLILTAASSSFDASMPVDD